MKQNVYLNAYLQTILLYDNLSSLWWRTELKGLQYTRAQSGKKFKRSIMPSAIARIIL